MRKSGDVIGIRDYTMSLRMNIRV